MQVHRPTLAPSLTQASQATLARILMPGCRQTQAPGAMQALLLTRVFQSMQVRTSMLVRLQMLELLLTQVLGLTLAPLLTQASQSTLAR